MTRVSTALFPNENFSLYDIACACLALIPFIAIGVLIAIALIAICPPASAYDTTTLYIYPNITGYTTRTGDNVTFSDLNTGSGTVAYYTSTGYSPAALLLAGTTSDRYQAISRYIHIINTSPIPDNALNLTVKGNYRWRWTSTTIGTPNMVITGGFPTSNVSLVAGDYTKFDTNRIADNVSFTTLNVNNWYNITFTNTSFVDKEGHSYVYFRNSYDTDATPPTWGSGKSAYANIYNVLESGTTYDPFYEFTYDLPSNPLDYYAVGDSITEAINGGDLAADGSDVYLYQMLDAHNATATRGHNTNGAGWTSTDGKNNFDTLPGSPYPKQVFVEFGFNDGVIPASTTGANLKAIYNGYTANGSDTNILIQTLANPSGEGEWAAYVNQRDNITITKNYLTAEGIDSVDLWDSIDTIPYNCEIDEVNTSLMVDHYHPNKEGHRLMGEYIWNYLNGTLPDCGTTPPAGVPVPSFVANVTCGSVPFYVQFTDTSTGTPTEWNWSSNGNYSDEQNPVFFYDTVGRYSVNLNATNSFGPAYFNETDSIRAVPDWYECPIVMTPAIPNLPAPDSSDLIDWVFGTWWLWLVIVAVLVLTKW